MPWTPDRFDELVDEAVASLPKWVHDALDNVEVFVEDAPPPGQPTLLGLYQGIPLTKRGSNYTWAVPDRITLYRATIEGIARGSDARLRDVIAHTVAHEVAHHFGITDDRLREIDAY
jgi:predicted Zn-dependent protease with MMP-like domain